MLLQEYQTHDKKKQLAVSALVLYVNSSVVKALLNHYKSWISSQITFRNVFLLINKGYFPVIKSFHPYQLLFRKTDIISTYVCKYIHFQHILADTGKYERHIQPSNRTCHYILHLKRHLTIAVYKYPAGIYFHKVSNGNTRTMCEICSKLKKKTPE